MAGARSGTSLFFVVVVFLPISAAAAAASRDCSLGNASAAGSEAAFVMVQHQLRGVVRPLDACSFAVYGFDMIAGSDVRWWGAAGNGFRNLTAGFAISDQPLNGTYRNDSFTVFLSQNHTLHQIGVIAVWDAPTFSNFGHVFLNANPTPPSKRSDLYPKQASDQPTMFQNCKVLSPEFRLRWTLGAGDIDIGLEAAVTTQTYMAFGWAQPSSPSSSSYMLHADVAIAGFTEQGEPFADDYFITQYSECLVNKVGVVGGVCPDSIYEGFGPTDPVGLVNNTRLVYGHRKDGVSFIRYQRPLESLDGKYDVKVKRDGSMVVVWALGLIRPPDAFRPYYLPQNHGGARFVSYDYLNLNVSEVVDECIGPLEAVDGEDQDIVFADGKSSLVVSSSPAMHYPNPPNPVKVMYVNKKEAPVLRVERGVPVKFSIQAGHDVALYITSDPIGGNATSRNLSEVIYAGGPDSHGVPASPAELVWLPDRNTPDQVYYHSIYEQKMGWIVQVVDGGLSDMYSNSVVLDDQQVNFFWTLYDDSISIAARAEKKSGYLAVGFGGGMVNSFAYVGWVDDSGVCLVAAYWIDGKDAVSIHRTHENLTYVRCKSENGILTFEFTRPLKPSCNKRGSRECSNKIDPTTPLRVVWAMGAKWSEDGLSERNMHFATSSRPVRVMLMRGSAEAEQDLLPVLAVHGFMMFVAWGILLPGGILAARYLKHVKGDMWFQLHVYLQYSGLAIVLLGVLFAAAELRGFSIQSTHVKFGVAAIVLACMQAVNGYVRPKKPENGDSRSSKSALWEYSHTISGRCAIIVGVAALITGLNHLGERYGVDDVRGLNWALVIWFALGALLVAYLEYNEIKQKHTARNLRKGKWVLGSDEEDDSVDLLRIDRGQEAYPSDRLELQLKSMRS